MNKPKIKDYGMVFTGFMEDPDYKSYSKDLEKWGNELEIQNAKQLNLLERLKDVYNSELLNK